MKWLFCLWLLLTIIGATVMGWVEKSTSKPLAMHMICREGACEVEGELTVGIPTAPAYEWHKAGPTDRGMYVFENGRAKEYTIDEAIAERSEQ